MYKNPIIVCFIIATLIIIQIVFSIGIDAIVKNGGIFLVLKECVLFVWFLYIPLIIFILLEVIKRLLKQEKILKILKGVNNFCITISIIFYVLFEIFFLMIDSAFKNM